MTETNRLQNLVRWSSAYPNSALAVLGCAVLVGPLILIPMVKLLEKGLPGPIEGAVGLTVSIFAIFFTIVQPGGLFLVAFAAWRAVHEWEKRRDLRRRPRPVEGEPCPMCGAAIRVPERCLGCGETFGPNPVKTKST